ncbi:hypothetical protein D3C76_1325220 [compost metagenome]
MLQKKHSIKIEISADRKLFELQGISTEDALKILEAAQAIKVTHCIHKDMVQTGSAPSTQE